jgi:hypothetical protein
MKTELALRYLLLRHLKKLEPVVPPPRFQEVTRSLVVRIARDEYVITWESAGEMRREAFPRSAFVFYARGDRSDADDAAGNPQNDALAREFASAALGVAAPTSPTERRLLHPGAVVVESVVLAAVFATAGALGIAVGAAVLGFSLAELAPGGRFMAALMTAVLAIVGPPWAGACVALGYGALQLIDPNSMLRLSRAGLCGAAFLTAGVRLVTTGVGVRGGWLLPVIGVAALTLAIGRSLYADHFRTAPLVLPLYAFGLFMDGRTRASVVGLGVLAAGGLATGIRRPESRRG